MVLLLLKDPMKEHLSISPEYMILYGNFDTSKFVLNVLTFLPFLPEFMILLAIHSVMNFYFSFDITIGR